MARALRLLSWRGTSNLWSILLRVAPASKRLNRPHPSGGGDGISRPCGFGLLGNARIASGRRRIVRVRIWGGAASFFSNDHSQTTTVGAACVRVIFWVQPWGGGGCGQTTAAVVVCRIAGRLDIDGPIRACSILCPALHAHVQADAIANPVWAVVRFPVLARDVLLHKPGTFGVEATVFARGASTDQKMLMRLTTIPLSAEEVRVGQADETIYVTSCLRSEAGMACFSARCLETLVSLGCKACLQCRQIRAGSGQLKMSPSLCNLCVRSSSFIRLHACLLLTRMSLVIIEDSA